MARVSVNTIADFFDEYGEEYLVPFDVVPNKHLPQNQRKTYRIKDFFKASYRNRICIYWDSEIELCRAKFHQIFFDNLIHMIQVSDEETKLKMMADHDHYDFTNRSDRTVNTTNIDNNSSNATTTNKTKASDGTGNLLGSVDAIQMGSVLGEDVRVIDTKKLPHYFDKNIRQYTQTVNIGESITDVTVMDNGTSSGTYTTNGTQTIKSRNGVEALNQVRAHSLQVRRLREEFIQCFNVLFF